MTMNSSQMQIHCVGISQGEFQIRLQTNKLAALEQKYHRVLCGVYKIHAATRPRFKPSNRFSVKMFDNVWQLNEIQRKKVDASERTYTTSE